MCCLMSTRVLKFKSNNCLCYGGYHIVLINLDSMRNRQRILLHLYFSSEDLQSSRHFIDVAFQWWGNFLFKEYPPPRSQ